MKNERKAYYLYYNGKFPVTTLRKALEWLPLFKQSQVLKGLLFDYSKSRNVWFQFQKGFNIF